MPSLHCPYGSLHISRTIAIINANTEQVLRSSDFSKLSEVSPLEAKLQTPGCSIDAWLPGVRGLRGGVPGLGLG